MKRLIIALAVVLVVGAALVADVFHADAVLGLRHRLALSLVRYASATELEVRGAGSFKMFLNPEDMGLTPILMFRHQWEPNETFWIVKSLKPGDTFVDVGANVGYYTIVASRIVGETGRVYAFEPDPESFAILEANVRLNGLDNVILEQKAVSNGPGTLELFLAEANRGDHRLYQPKHGPARESVVVEAVSLDDYFANREEKVDFIKIDTQGAEGVIFEGLMGLAATNPDMRMAIEWWPFGVAGLDYDPDKLRENVVSLGFRFYDLGRVGDVAPLVNRSADQLRLAYTVKNRSFTNVYLTRRPGPARVPTQQPAP